MLYHKENYVILRHHFRTTLKAQYAYLMKNQSTSWNKSELEIYIMLVCANADAVQTEHELSLIKSRSDTSTFEKIYKEFSQDSEEESLDKIDECIQFHEFDDMELAKFRRDIYELFMTDGIMDNQEANIDRILDNILY